MLHFSQIAKSRKITSLLPNKQPQFIFVIQFHGHHSCRVCEIEVKCIILDRKNGFVSLVIRSTGGENLSGKT